MSKPLDENDPRVRESRAIERTNSIAWAIVDILNSDIESSEDELTRSIHFTAISTLLCDLALAASLTKEDLLERMDKIFTDRERQYHESNH